MGVITYYYILLTVELADALVPGPATAERPKPEAARRELFLGPPGTVRRQTCASGTCLRLCSSALPRVACLPS